MVTIRPDWVARTEEAVERLTDDLSTIDVRDGVHRLLLFVDLLEAPPDAVHGAVLSTILIDVCSRVVQLLHEQNPPTRCSCDATIWSHVGRFGQWREPDPRIAFRDWVQVYFAGLGQSHPTDIAVRAAHAIRREPARSWTIDLLADAVGGKAAALRREFQARFGLRPSAYVHLVRVTRAISLLRGPTKVEAVAWEVGYKSKKDLYAALSRWADATPTELRALSDAECEWLERELRMQCLRGAGARRLSLRAVADGARGSAGRRGSRR